MDHVRFDGVSARRLLAYYSSYGVRLGCALVMVVGSAVFVACLPAVAGVMVDELYQGVAAGAVSRRALVGLVALLVCLHAAASLFSYAARVLMGTLASLVGSKLRDQVQEKAYRLPVAYFDARAADKFALRMSDDLDMVETTLASTISRFLRLLVTVVCVVLMLLSTSWQVALVAVAVAVLTRLASHLANGSVHPWEQRVTGQRGALQRYVEDMYAGHEVLQAPGLEERASRGFDQLNARLTAATRKATSLAGIIDVVDVGIANAGYVVAAAVGCLLAADGALSVGGVMTALLYLWFLAVPQSMISSVAQDLARGLDASARVFAFLDEHDEIPDPADGLTMRMEFGALRFEDVGFGQEPGHVFVRDASFVVREQSKVAIVGPAGAGKSVLARLLVRLYELDEGAILVGDIDMRSMSREEIRSRMSLASRGTWILKGTVRDNLLYGHDGLTDVQLAALAKSARVDHAIRSLPQGLDTVIADDDERLGAGVRQQLCLARAMASGKDIVLLNEALSQVDARTETVVQDTFSQACTSLVVTDRPATARDADCIIYMEGGSILEAGTHDELMALNGRYAALYRAQFA